MIINHNMQALNAHRQMGTNSTNAQKSMEKLSSGLRINRAGDDAAGLSISEKMRSQIRGLDQAGRNAQDGISMIQTAEGALNETHSILQRMRELSVQSANGTNTDSDRNAIQEEVNQLKDEINRIADTTEFNTQKLLNGNLSGSTSTSGANTTTGITIGKGVASSITGTDSKAVNGSTVDFTTTDTINIDGTEVTVNWDKYLSDDAKALIKGNYATTNMTADQSKEIAAAMEKAINSAIDESGKSIDHISVKSTAAGILKMESSVKGSESKIDFTGTANSVLGKMMQAGTATQPTTKQAGQWQVSEAILNTDKVKVDIGGIKLEVTLDAANAGTDVKNVATDLQTKLNTAIGDYNTLAGVSAGDEGYIEDVRVELTKDGKLQIASPSGTAVFEESTEGVLGKLGLDKSQTATAGNGAMSFQIGANKDQSIAFSIDDMSSSALGMSKINVSSKDGAESAVKIVDSAIEKVSTQRSKLGAIQNRLEHTINNLGTSSENLTAAESRIRDVDMAKEMMEMSKNNILSQASQAMLAQANQAPQQVLQLLR